MAVQAHGGASITYDVREVPPVMEGSEDRSWARDAEAALPERGVLRAGLVWTADLPAGAKMVTPWSG